MTNVRNAVIEVTVCFLHKNINMHCNLLFDSTIYNGINHKLYFQFEFGSFI